MTFRNAHALVVGIGRYAHISQLAKSANDARSVIELLIDPEFCGYEPGNVKLLLEEQADKQAIRDGLSWLAAQARSDSTALIFFAGHGGQDPSNALSGNYLLPYECDPYDDGELSVAKLAQSSIPSMEFTAALREIKSQKLVVIFDCCHSGGIGDTSRDLRSRSPSQMRPGLSDRYYEALGLGEGRVILASCKASERSWERATLHNGIFTTHLLAALRGRAAVRRDGLIRILDVYDDLRLHVPPDAADCRDPETGMPAEQHPILKASIQDNFSIALHRGGTELNHTDSEGTPHALAPLTDIRLRITGDPIVGVQMLIEILMSKPEWEPYTDALGVRLALLERAEEQRRNLGMISPALEADRRESIYYALSVCRDVEDQMRQGLVS